MPKPDTPKQRASAQEKALAQIALEKDQRHQSAFLPLEQDAINELSSADAGTRSAMIAGRQAADLEAQAAAVKANGLRGDIAAGNFGGGATMTRNARHAGAIEQGKDAVRASADQQARDSIDQDTLNVVKTGQGLARTSQSTLTQAARLANKSAASKLEAEFMRDSARTGAITEVAVAGGIAGYDAYSRAFGKHKSGLDAGTYKVEYDELNSFQKGLRGLRGPKNIYGPTRAPT